MRCDKVGVMFAVRQVGTWDAPSVSVGFGHAGKLVGVQPSMEGTLLGLAIGQL